jgi:hypothetical protein
LPPRANTGFFEIIPRALTATSSPEQQAAINHNTAGQH